MTLDDTEKEKKYSYVGTFCEVQPGLFLAVAIADDNNWVHVKKDLKPAYKAMFAEVDDFCGPLAPAKELESEKWGFINYEGKFQYFRPKGFSSILNLFSWTMITIENQEIVYRVGWNGKALRVYLEDIVPEPVKNKK